MWIKNEIVEKAPDWRCFGERQCTHPCAKQAQNAPLTHSMERRSYSRFIAELYNPREARHHAALFGIF